jgi:hypothetical protein
MVAVMAEILVNALLQLVSERIKGLARVSRPALGSCAGTDHYLV